MGRFHEAAELFDASARKYPTSPYPVLWLHAARAQAHEPDDTEFRQGIGRQDPSAWPAQISEMFLGKLTPDKMREAYSTSPYGPAEGNCEAVFFAVKFELIRNEPGRAHALFAEGTGACDNSATHSLNESQFLVDWAELIRLDPKAREAARSGDSKSRSPTARSVRLPCVLQAPSSAVLVPGGLR
jgi:lipoprotein NlpI